MFCSTILGFCLIVGQFSTKLTFFSKVGKFFSHPKPAKTRKAPTATKAVRHHEEIKYAGCACQGRETESRRQKGLAGRTMAPRQLRPRTVRRVKPTVSDTAGPNGGSMV